MERVMALALATLALTGILLVAKAAGIAFVASSAFGRPAFHRRISEAYQAHPWRAAAIGLANTLVALFFIAVLLNNEPLALIGIAMGAGLCAVHLLGRSAYYQVIAERLSDVPVEGRPIGPWLRGAAAAELSFLVPILGQGLFLLVTMRCAGAFIMALLARPPLPQSSAESPGD